MGRPTLNLDLLRWENSPYIWAITRGGSIYKRHGKRKLLLLARLSSVLLVGSYTLLLRHSITGIRDYSWTEQLLSLGLSVGRQPFLTSWTTACKPRSFMYTYIHIQSISSIPLENFKMESCLTTDPFRKTLIYKLDKHPSTYKQQSAY